MGIKKYIALVLSIFILLNVFISPVFAQENLRSVDLNKYKMVRLSEYLDDGSIGDEYSYTQFELKEMYGFRTYNPVTSDILLSFSVQFTQEYDIKLYKLKEEYSLEERPSSDFTSQNEIIRDYYDTLVDDGTNDLVPGDKTWGTYLGNLVLYDDQDGVGVAAENMVFQGYTHETPTIREDKETPKLKSIDVFDGTNNNYIWKGGVIDVNDPNATTQFPLLEGDSYAGTSADCVIVIEPKGLEKGTEWTRVYVSPIALKISYSETPPTEGVWEYCVLKGDPINMQNGNFYFSYTPLKIHGNNPLEFTLNYNSVATNVGQLGYGFRHNYSYELKDLDYMTKIKLADGREINFEYNLDGTYKDTSQGKLIRTYVGYTLFMTDGYTYNFSPNGYIQGIKKGEKTIASMSYIGDNLNKVKTDSGELHFTYETHSFELLPKYKNIKQMKATTPSAISLNGTTTSTAISINNDGNFIFESDNFSNTTTPSALSKQFLPTQFYNNGQNSKSRRFSWKKYRICI